LSKFDQRFGIVEDSFDSVGFGQIFQHVLVGLVDQDIGNQSVAMLREGIVSTDGVRVVLVELDQVKGVVHGGGGVELVEGDQVKISDVIYGLKGNLTLKDPTDLQNLTKDKLF
jgi:hypothetical protein